MLEYNFREIKKCKEAWEEMVQTDCGRLCGACNKIIYDYRGLSVLDIMLRQADRGGASCGVYDDLVGEYKDVSVNYVSYPKLALFILGMLPVTSVQGQDYLNETKAPFEQVSKIPNLFQLIENDSSVLLPPKVVYGQIRSIVSGEPIVGALIQLQGTSFYAVSGIEGNYKLEVDGDSFDVSSGVLRCTYLGFLQELKGLNTWNQLDKTIDFELKENTALVFGVTISKDPHPARKTGIWARFNTFKRNFLGSWVSSNE